MPKTIGTFGGKFCQFLTFLADYHPLLARLDTCVERIMMEQVEPKSPKQAMAMRRMPSTRKESEEIHSGGSWGGGVESLRETESICLTR